MIVQIAKNASMANDFETNWIDMQVDNSYNLNDKSKVEVASIQIFWDSVVGVLNGYIEIYSTNTIDSKAFLATYNINSASNKDNSILLELKPIYKSIKLLYHKNGITDGRLNAFLYYKM